ncbi:MBL fold metallo-hydrolase [Prosthecomicrobium sp. N25]|uniref:MBL fold metallo-hydrolase n=1 Tax=Prosthecomicrobium sp. N25 TaxID=3129254 RepID=UPI0030787732
MRIHFVGTGDAFGTGGRFNTCFHLTAGGTNMLVDCGASAFYALKQTGLDLNAISAILITHFHGDHFGGLPYYFLDAQFVSLRRAPLLVAGPPGVREACDRLLEASYPGFSTVPREFEVLYQEIAPDETAAVAGAQVTARKVQHDPHLSHCYGYRIETGGKVFAYSGDTAWTETLVPLARGADLFVCECYVRSRKIKVHLDYETLKQHLPAIAARRVLLTHMSADMLDHLDEIAEETARDGLVVEI